MAKQRIKPLVGVILVISVAALTGWSGGVDFSAWAGAPWTWETTNKVTQSRLSHTATLVEIKKPDGSISKNVLVAGGLGDKYAPRTSSEMYDLDKGRWIGTNGGLKAGRFVHTATLLTGGPQKGKVLVAGGAKTMFESLDSSELFDPSKKAWAYTQDSDLNQTKLIDARSYHTATLLTSGPNAGKVLVAGGQKKGSDPLVQPTYLDTCELYDSGTGVWTKTNDNLKQARSNHTATLLPDGTGRVLVAAGAQGGQAFTPINSCELWQPPATLLSPQRVTAPVRKPALGN